MGPCGPHRLQPASEAGNTAPLLALEEARARKATADAEICRLLANGRASRPYRLTSLAEASWLRSLSSEHLSMSLSSRRWPTGR